MHRFKKSNGDISTGQTIFLHKMYHEVDAITRYYHFIIDMNANDDIDTVQWVSFSEAECNSTSTLSKKVYPGNETYLLPFSS